MFLDLIALPISGESNNYKSVQYAFPLVFSYVLSPRSSKSDVTPEHFAARDFSYFKGLLFPLLSPDLKDGIFMAVSYSYLHIFELNFIFT
jgi:hypothetical protein